MPIKNKERQRERDKGVIDAWYKGSPIKTIMRLFSISDKGIYYVLDRHGIKRSPNWNKGSWKQLDLFDDPLP